MEENKPLETQPSAQSPNKMDENKIMAILSYLSILCLIPLFTKKDNEFVYYHAKQGLVLFGFETIVYIVLRLLISSLAFSVLFGLFGIIGIISTVLNLFFLALSILGIVNVTQNKKTALPLIGKIAEGLKF